MIVIHLHLLQRSSRSQCPKVRQFHLSHLSNPARTRIWVTCFETNDNCTRFMVRNEQFSAFPRQLVCRSALLRILCSIYICIDIQRILRSNVVAFKSQLHHLSCRCRLKAHRRQLLSWVVLKPTSKVGKADGICNLLVAHIFNGDL